MLVSQAALSVFFCFCFLFFLVLRSVAQTRQNGCKGAHRVINLEQFPLRISKDEGPATPLPTAGILFIFPDFLFFSFFLFSFFLCLFRFQSMSIFVSLYSFVRFLAFQSVFVVTTPAFTVVINTNRSLQV